MVIVANPRTFKIPDWFLNRQKDHKDGRYSQLTSSALDTKLRDDLERLKKIRCVAAPHLIRNIGGHKSVRFVSWFTRTGGLLSVVGITMCVCDVHISICICGLVS